MSTLEAAYDGPIPPAELAMARWGRGAFRRIARVAAATAAEAWFRASQAALRRAVELGDSDAAATLEQLVADRRRCALAALAGL